MSWLAAVGRASIWHPDAIPAGERKYASPLKRVLFPVFDAAIILFGIAGLRVGFQAMTLTFPMPVPSIIYGLLIAAGAICFIGCAFPRLWVQEIVGKLVILMTLGVLLVAMLIAGTTIPGHTGVAVAPMVFVMTLPPFLRLWLLGVEWGDRGTS
ncbi:hypothetical protein AB0230_01780 [Microbacterium sp. NPDC089190]|uniref:hypothetical protein n=1 Tax=Microbacterium sp. NPDC089190 TaxID=3155063 RepID=UPI00344B8809